MKAFQDLRDQDPRERADERYGEINANFKHFLVCVCVCMCVREREKEREREGGREREIFKLKRGRV